MIFFIQAVNIMIMIISKFLKKEKEGLSSFSLLLYLIYLNKV
jgi:hypothetical protein